MPLPVDLETVLISGPMFSGRQRLFHQLLDSWTGDSLIISTRQIADSVRTTHQQVCDPPRGDSDPLVIDSVTSTLNRSPEETPRTKYAQHPSNLVSIGTKFTEILKEHEQTEIGVGLTTVSPLLVYASSSDIFQFLNLILQKSISLGWPVAVIIDPTAHDATTIEQLVPLFEDVIETRRTETGVQEYRLRNLHTTEWTPIPTSQS